MTYGAQSDFPVDLTFRYRYIGLLGRGAMGVVYRVYDNNLGKEVAIKTLPGGELNTKRMMRFQKEAKAIGRLEHANLVTVYDFGVTKSGQPYMVMELVEGVALSEFRQSNRLEIPAVIHIMLQIIAAVAHAHSQGVLHRDLKPHNVILEEPQSPFPIARVIDFGVAQLRGPEEPQGFDSTGGVGSPAYMSPQSTRGEQVDARADIYSLGCLFFECLTGRIPFQADSVVEMARLHAEAEPPKLSELIDEDSSSEALENELEIRNRLEAIVTRCLEKEPEKRYQTVEELFDAVGEVADLIPDVEPVRARLQPDTGGGDQIFDQLARQATFFLPSLDASAARRWIVTLMVGATVGLLCLMLVRGFNKEEKVIADASKHMIDEIYDPERFATHERLALKALNIEHEHISDEQLKSGKGLPLNGEYNFGQSDVTDEGMKYLADKDFYSLDLSYTKVTNKGLEALGRISKISDLRLVGLPIDDAGVESIRRLPLATLNLKQTKITNRSLEIISTMKTIDTLDLSSCDITDSGLELLVALPKLHTLTVDNTHTSMKPISRLKRLVNLSESHNGITDDDIKLLVDLRLLDYLQMTEANITRRSFDYLLELPNLHKLRIAECHAISKFDMDSFVERFQKKYKRIVNVQNELPYQG